MTTAALHLDYETRSTVDLRKTGAYKYAEHPSTGVWCFSWKFDGEETRLWLEGDPLPQRVVDHIAAGGKVVAHNAAFERIITNLVMRRHGFPELKIEQQDCTMARGLAMGLPGGLDQLGMAMRTPIQKDKEGSALMMRLCRPRRIEADGTIVWWDDPAKVQRLGAYCVTDTDTEVLVDQGLPLLTDSEQAVWRLDQKINDRGVAVDVALVERAIAVVTEAQRRADDEMWRLTDGEVKKCSEAARLVDWLNARGVPCESVAKGEMEELVVKAAMIDAEAEAAVRLRRASAKSSTAKFKAMLNSVCADGRCRGTLQYHAAGTGRWGGRLIQPQNLPRINDPRAVDRTIELLGVWEIPPRGLVDALEMLVDNPLDALSQCLRAMLVAGPGKKFVGGDFSNIEGRIAAWMAGENWKVQAFRDFDAGTGPDLYKLAYAKSFGIAVDDVDKAGRQLGKVQELALQFQGGVGAFQTMAAGYGVRVTDERADELKVAWRDAHPQIVHGWWDLQDAAIEAVGCPGARIYVYGGKVAYLAANGFLFCQLPSKRVIAYAQPRLEWTETKFGKPKRQIVYMGVDSITKRWCEQRLYGGLQFNNCVQGTARDVMVESMHRAEAEGFEVVLTVHDELLTEAPQGSLIHTADTLQECMATLPAWAQGLPLAAAAWEDTRYVK